MDLFPGLNDTDGHNRYSTTTMVEINTFHIFTTLSYVMLASIVVLNCGFFSTDIEWSL